MRDEGWAKIRQHSGPESASRAIGIHAARRGTRFEALEPLRQGVRRHFGAIGKDVAHGLAVRHDHGSPEGNGCTGVSSGRSRRTCYGFGPSTPPKSSGSHCSHFATSTTRPGSSRGSTTEPLPRSDRRNFQPSRSPRRLLTDVSLTAGGTGVGLSPADAMVWTAFGAQAGRPYGQLRLVALFLKTAVGR